MALTIGTPLPSLDGATEWLDGDADSVAAQRTPLLVQFWSFSCPACKSNVPGVLGFLSTYEEHGLRLLSIHMPRGEWDLDIDKIRSVATELGLVGASAIDNAHVLGRKFQTEAAWPSYFFFDAEGRLRSRAAGRMGLKLAENSLVRILGSSVPTISGATSKL
jgi:thiol-disulfide isomerase/thioredoxin